ncbi:hypothetical protein CMI47_04595 [Candidatus Pacearchaeota archaeon]|jgi:hypothetical protein|nr:hypothetical protein [Candidatus Pacearchaeota archaeon]|tara:strand:- start:10038 stop:10316 length:279 start_codon:yes stop_codon:yes gene_type:complete
MNDDNVVSFQKDGTRAMLGRVLKAYDEGRIQSVIMIGQGTMDAEDGTSQRVLMPLVSEETSVSELTFAAALLQGYAQNTVQYLMVTGVRKDA